MQSDRWNATFGRGTGIQRSGAGGGRAEQEKHASVSAAAPHAGAMRLTSMLLALILTAATHGASPSAAVAAAAGERFTFVALGCMPYGEANYAGYERLLAEISRHQPAFTVHCGDTKGGGEPPSDALLERVRRWFDAIDSAVIYTPGDNEWTDVHRENNGRQDPLVWLAKVRALYFATEQSMGRRPIPLVTQRRDPAFAKFVENARWTRGGVVFATVHVVGSNNNCQPGIPGAMEEFRERDAANVAWVRATFAEARRTTAAGVALFFQAEPIGPLGAVRPGRESGFARFLETVEVEARSFAKPVLLVHADEHRYRHEPGVRLRPGSEPLPNVTRLETFGAGDLHAVIVVVDPGSPQVFLAGPLLVPGNALPVLPRPRAAATTASQ
jgi:hypothetical protein